MLEQNWDAVQVFMRCSQSWVSAGMAGAFASGITAQEMSAAAAMLGVPVTPELAQYVQEMGHVASKALNERNQK